GRGGGEGGEEGVHERGRLAGREQAERWGRLANENEPTLPTHDRVGNRLDEVEYHPHYHDLMDVAVSHNMHAAPWRDDRSGAHVARAAKFYTWTQAAARHLCPISMTYAASPARR